MTYSIIESTLLCLNGRESIKTLFATAAAAVLSHAAAAQATDCAAPSAPAPFETTEVAEDGLIAAFLAPNDGAPGPALLVLGGSEGGTDIVRALGAPFAAEGYAVLALSYFGADGLPANLEEIPVEYFRRAVDWLASRPEVDPDRIGVYGVSKGAEAALLVASRDARLKAVAAGAPSHVVWQNINRQDFTPRSSWSESDEPLPFVPYEMSKGFTTVFALYDDALASVGEDSAAIIPAEDVAGPVLLISGAADTMWPSSKMADLVMKRLEKHDFAHSHVHLRYEDAGHGVSVPPSIGEIFGGPDSYVGGDDESNAAGRRDMWAQMRCFFDSALGG